MEPFEVELVEDTIHGGLAFRDRNGVCHRLTGPNRPRCEWAQMPSTRGRTVRLLALVVALLGFAAFTML